MGKACRDNMPVSERLPLLSFWGHSGDRRHSLQPLISPHHSRRCGGRWMVTVAERIRQGALRLGRWPSGCAGNASGLFPETPWPWKRSPCVRWCLLWKTRQRGAAPEVSGPRGADRSPRDLQGGGVALPPRRASPPVPGRGHGCALQGRPSRPLSSLKPFQGGRRREEGAQSGGAAKEGSRRGSTVSRARARAEPAPPAGAAEVLPRAPESPPPTAPPSLVSAVSGPLAAPPLPRPQQARPLAPAHPVPWKPRPRGLRPPRGPAPAGPAPGPGGGGC